MYKIMRYTLTHTFYCRLSSQVQTVKYEVHVELMYDWTSINLTLNVWMRWLYLMTVSQSGGYIS